jgi:hypothetical protein
LSLILPVLNIKSLQMLKRLFFFISIISILFTSCEFFNSNTLFTSVSSSASNINFKNTLKEGKGLSILYYLYFYNGGGVATGDINNDGLADIYFTANSKGSNKLYLNKGNFEFEDITQQAGVQGVSDWASGVTMADVNADGFLDIYVSTVSNRYGLVGHNELFINNKNNTFSEQSEKYGLNLACFTTQSAFFDYDHDGDLDCYILNQSHNPHSNIVDTSFRRNYDSLTGDRLYRNDIATTGKFTNVSATAGIYQSNLGYGLGLAIADFDNDGWEDIYVGNDFHENDYYYINNRKGGFTEQGAAHFKHYSRFSMGNDAADYNNDGQLDIITVDMLPDKEKILKTYGSDENLDIYKMKLNSNGYQDQFSRNALQRNNGNGASFSETALLSGVAASDWSWSPLFADFDNDGNKDLFITSGIVKRPVDLDYIKFVSALQNKGLSATDKYDQEAIDAMPDGSSHPFFFKGDGKINFTEVSNKWGTGRMKGYFNGASYADLDNDGDLDIVVNSINEKALVLKNNTTAKNTLQVALKGSDNNTFGIGAKVYVFSQGNMQYQQLMSTRGFQSSVNPLLHFALSEKAKVDSILVIWPTQQYQVVKGPVSKASLILKQSDARGNFNFATYFPNIIPSLIPIKGNAGVNWKHIENDFVDFNKQYLIPHALSTQGPKIAVGDINKDGLEDFYVCGASGQAGVLMTQNKTGNFIATDTAVFSNNKFSEEVDALFFDANNDGFEDLYIVSGGNEYNDGSLTLNDKLYMNDGKGHFKNASVNIPATPKNKSCVKAEDIDKDGDIDLFVGGLADANKYGVPQRSYLLLNNGKGVFTIATASVINLIDIGMVTCANFADFNSDGWPDLALTGEWMPVKIFMNQKGKFIATDLPKSTGLWQSIQATDINGDGFVDLLAGNLGLNSKLAAGKQGPLKLYVKDFDNNGSIEQVMAYTIEGKEYPFLAKDELERTIPVLKKAYLKYEEVAGKTVQYIFFDLFKDYSEFKAEQLASAYFLNDGKGNFKMKNLPAEMQLAPIYTFVAQQTPNTYIGMGNLYGVIPYEGRYDALQPTSFVFDKKGDAVITKHASIAIEGEVRDAKWIKLANGKKALIVGRSNEKLLFFETP